MRRWTTSTDVDDADRELGYPIVLLLDMKMPKMSGLQVLQEMKADAVLRTIPVVMLTSSREERDLAQSYKAGVNAYIVKPVDFERFIGAVKEVASFWGKSTSHHRCWPGITIAHEALLKKSQTPS